ncbi:Tellurium resistance [Streptomyces sp. NPDC001262]|uniref:Tellurium resistance n=1 Tax=Streptomyces TaxID=1883 RepID=UPI0036D0C729
MTWEYWRRNRPEYSGTPLPAPSPEAGGGSLWSYLVRSHGSPRAGMFGDPMHNRLTKGHPVVSLADHGATAGTLRVNLTWQTPSADFRPVRDYMLPRWSKRAGRWEQRQGPAMVTVDLDLACMYELADGQRGVVQPLGDLSGDLYHPPYITLGDDNRFGAASGETLYINLDKAAHFRRLLIFAYIYSGAPAFSRVHAAVSFHPPTGQRLVVELREQAQHARSCAVALIENRNGQLTMRREARYVYGYQADLDRLYGWGLQWARGRKAAQ